MRKILCLGFAVLVFAGCAAFRQAGEDKRLSDATPVAAGELTPHERAARMAAPLASLPYGAGAVAVPLATAGLAWFFGWRRGRKIRLGSLPASERPVSGALGKATGLEGLIQHVADISAGVLNFGKPGGGLKRTWKGTAIAALGFAVYPFIAQLIGAVQGNEIPVNPLFAAPLVGVLMGLEKWLSNVLPLKKNEAPA